MTWSCVGGERSPHGRSASAEHRQSRPRGKLLRSLRAHCSPSLALACRADAHVLVTGITFFSLSGNSHRAAFGAVDTDFTEIEAAQPRTRALCVVFVSCLVRHLVVFPLGRDTPAADVLHHFRHQTLQQGAVSVSSEAAS